MAAAPEILPAWAFVCFALDFALEQAASVSESHPGRTPA
jgi:hypothetical protein